MEWEEDQEFVNQQETLMVVSLMGFLYSVAMMLVSSLFSHHLLSILFILLFGIGSAVSLTLLTTISPTLAYVGFFIWFFIFAFICYHNRLRPKEFKNFIP